jgi:hypothetical protein
MKSQARPTSFMGLARPGLPPHLSPFATVEAALQLGKAPTPPLRTNTYVKSQNTRLSLANYLSGRVYPRLRRKESQLFPQHQREVSAWSAMERRPSLHLCQLQPGRLHKVERLHCVGHYRSPTRRQHHHGGVQGFRTRVERDWTSCSQPHDCHG